MAISTMSKSSILRMAVSIGLPQRWLWMPPKMALRHIWQAALHVSDRKLHPSLVKRWLQRHITLSGCSRLPMDSFCAGKWILKSKSQRSHRRLNMLPSSSKANTPLTMCTAAMVLRRIRFRTASWMPSRIHQLLALAHTSHFGRIDAFKPQALLPVEKAHRVTSR